MHGMCYFSKFSSNSVAMIVNLVNLVNQSLQNAMQEERNHFAKEQAEFYHIYQILSFQITPSHPFRTQSFNRERIGMKNELPHYPRRLPCKLSHFEILTKLNLSYPSSPKTQHFFLFSRDITTFCIKKQAQVNSGSSRTSLNVQK